MFVKGLVGAVGVLALAVGALAIGTAPDESPPRPPTVVSDVGLLPMIEDHALMTEQMRAAAPSERMTSSMVTDRMWGDWSLDMVREQEAYQAQIDRMLARR